MALVLKDRVKESSIVTGTGAATLTGAAPGYDSFSVIGNGNTTYYAIVAQTSGEWEVGVGTYTSAGTSLSRDTILASSNSGSLVNFTAGVKDVFVTYPAGKSVVANDNPGDLGHVLTSQGAGVPPSWEPVPSGNTFTTSATAPSTPIPGDEWVDSNSGIKYTYVNDGNSSQWVQIETAMSISQTIGGGSVSIYSAEYVLSGTTTDANETELFIGGVAGTRIAVPLNKTVYYTADIVCRRTDSLVDNAAFYVKGVSANVAGVVSDVGLIYEVTVVRTDANFSVDIRADDTNNSVNVYVIGNTGKTLNWTCAMTILEV